MASSNRPADGLLHASSDLTGSLRHTQLRVAGAPMLPAPLLGKTRAKTGWLWHDELDRWLHEEGTFFVHGAKIDRFLPKGWSGTLDWAIWHDEYEGFVLLDVKTTSEAALNYIPKDEHIWQTSVYWHALAAMGLPVVDAIGLLYLPLDTKHSRRQKAHTSFKLVEFQPIEAEILLAEMRFRTERVNEYLEELVLDAEGDKGIAFVNDKLEPVQERVQKLSKREDKYELKLVPHWSSDYCPFDEVFCDCSTQGVTKIGEFRKEGKETYVYFPRFGYETLVPEVTPN